MRAFAALLFLVVALLLSSCDATANVGVAVHPDGHGQVRIELVIPPSTASQLLDLRDGIPVADLVKAGWSVAVHHQPSGGAVISAVHGFSRPDQVAVLVADLAGSGAGQTRPFRLVVQRSSGLLGKTYTATGMVALSCGLACFDDPSLAKSAGHPLGVPLSVLAKGLDAQAGSALSVHFTVTLPGKLLQGSTGAPPPGSVHQGAVSTARTWSARLGTRVRLEMRSVLVDRSRLREVVAVLSGVTLVPLATALALLVRYWRQRRSVRSLRGSYQGGLHAQSPA